MAEPIAQQDAFGSGVLQGILYPRELAAARGGVYSSNEARPYTQNVPNVYFSVKR